MKFFGIKKRYFLIILVVLTILLKFSVIVKDNKFFSVGADPIRHLVLIEEIKKQGKITYPKAPYGDYTAYIYYPPFFHVLIAELSILTNINPMIIQNIMSPLIFVLFYVLIYYIVKTIWKNEIDALFLSSLAVIVLPLTSPIPRGVVYYSFVPSLIYFSLEYLEKSGKKYMFLLGIIVASLSLLHSASALFYLFISSILVFLSGIFLKKKEIRIRFLNLWIISIISWWIGFMLYIIIMPSMWEATLHYTLAMLPSRMYGVLEIITTKYSPQTKIGLLIMPLITYLILKRLFTSKLITHTHKFSKYFSKALILVFFINSILLSGSFFVNLLLTMMHFVMLYFFYPSIPFFARRTVLTGMSNFILLDRISFAGITNPVFTGSVSLFLIALGSVGVLKLTLKRKLEESPHNLLLISYILPFSFLLPLSIFFNNPLINPDIFERLMEYTYVPAIVFSVLTLSMFFSRIKNKICISIFIIFIFIIFLAFSTINLTFISTPESNSGINQGYLWLTQNSLIPLNVKTMDYDVLGYYHVSHFPKEYRSIGGFITVTLLKEDKNYIPIISLDVFHTKREIKLPNLGWEGPLTGEYDDKIYANQDISFYHKNDKFMTS